MTISELEQYYNSIELPKGTIQLEQGTKILNVQNFVNSHIACAKNLGEKVGLPFILRLIKLKDILENQQ